VTRPAAARAAEDLPTAVATDAWTGTEAARGELDPRADRWGARAGLPPSQQPLDLGLPPNATDWRHPEVGYGVLLPESNHPPGDKAAGLDAPQPVRDLLAARPDTVMMRWDASLRPGLVTRYFPDGRTQPPDLLSGYGVAKGRLPRYVLIVGGPEKIPWSVQYALGTRRAVGRLPLSGDALGNYVTAMLSDWASANVDVRAPLMWTVDLPGDITAEMRAVIANPLEARLTDPRLPRFRHLTDGHATRAELLTALTAARPALVITSSHGLTEGTGTQLTGTLGLPVDAGHTPLELNALDNAMPPGAIWHAQACCSAGSEGPSKYAGLLGQGTTALAVVTAVAALGSTVAPAVTRLLGREQPVRAIIGHVEPTFDWTLRVAETGQGLANDLVAALSTNLYAGQPIGHAFSDYRAGVGELHAQWATAYDQRASGDVTVRPRLTRLRLTAFDRQSMVLLGDPTVTLPPLEAAS
jgi:hypothetical protein